MLFNDKWYFKSELCVEFAILYFNLSQNFIVKHLLKHLRMFYKGLEKHSRPEYKNLKLHGIVIGGHCRTFLSEQAISGDCDSR